MARKSSPQVSTERREAAPEETPESGEFDNFTTLAKRLVRVPKSEIDEARAAEDTTRRNGHK